MIARLAFPDGSVGVPGLRKEIRKQRLVAYKIAGKMMTSLDEIDRMKERCMIRPEVDPLPGAPRRYEQPLPEGMTEATVARLALRQKIEQLKAQFAEKAAADKARLTAHLPIRQRRLARKPRDV